MEVNNPHGALPLTSRDKVCKPECKGGLGISKRYKMLMQLSWLDWDGKFLTILTTYVLM